MKAWKRRLIVVLAALSLTGCGESYERKEILVETPEETVIQIGEEQAADGNTADKDQEDAEIVIAAGNTGSEAKQAQAGGGETDASLQTGEIKLLFGGDVLLSDHVLQAYSHAGGIEGVLDEGYRQAIADADFFMVNQEFPFSNQGTPAKDKQYTFRLPPEKVELFRQMEIDAVTLANNHALDFGQDALLDTCITLDGAGILHTGAGENLAAAKEPVVVTLGGKTIAIIGATRVIPVASWAAGNNHVGMVSTYDPAILLEEIRGLRENYDYVAVYVHWGIERDEMPQEYQKTLGRQYIDAGADLVIGAHPHVLQGIEYYQGKPIVYSLGNFVFGSSIPKTMLLEATLREDGETGLRLLPGTSGAGYTHMLTDEAKRQDFFQYMENISFGVTCLEDGTVAPQNPD